jgi:hypothetical protein
MKVKFFDHKIINLLFGEVLHWYVVSGLPNVVKVMLGQIDCRVWVVVIQESVLVDGWVYVQFLLVGFQIRFYGIVIVFVRLYNPFDDGSHNSCKVIAVKNGNNEIVADAVVVN